VRDAYTEFTALTEKQRAAVWDELTAISDEDLHESFDSDLDGTHQDVELCGLSYSPSYVLRRVDEPAYREAFNNWRDASEYVELDGSNFLAGDVLEAIDALETDD
jgi:hypothetical protein